MVLLSFRETLKFSSFCWETSEGPRTAWVCADKNALFEGSAGYSG